eukprot:TRINITY_DN6639_c0_g1_i1.p1 TRINITY_DN6639_c0_g1~~TRINITY_DN6639_c0_g1_i1.p1  ORF type:complete len:110 (-),score=4.40 TRINITY_DN6639_c0_g1_i1:32-361(-)
MNSQKVFNFVRGMSKLGRKKYKFRLAKPADNARLTGYEHNAVTPIGLKSEVPIILSDKILKNDTMWLGGGEVDLKWNVNVRQFVEKLGSFVGDIADELEESEYVNATEA